MRQRHAGNTFFFSCLSYGWKSHLGRMICLNSTGSGTKWKTQDSPSFFCSCENCWKRRYPAKCELKNACEFWEDVEAGIFSGNLFWMVLTCFGLKVYTKNVKCAVTTNSSPIVSSSSSPFKSRVSCILGTWILGGVHQIHKFLWN